MGKKEETVQTREKWGSSIERTEEKQLNNSRQKFGNGEAHIFGKDRGRGRSSYEAETEEGVSKYWLKY